jgi:hypothetical protein
VRCQSVSVPFEGTRLQMRAECGTLPSFVVGTFRLRLFDFFAM